MQESANGTKRTSREILLFVRFRGKSGHGPHGMMSAPDPKRTKAGLIFRIAAVSCLGVTCYPFGSTGDGQGTTSIRNDSGLSQGLPGPLRHAASPGCCLSTWSTACEEQ